MTHTKILVKTPEECRLQYQPRKSKRIVYKRKDDEIDINIIACEIVVEQNSCSLFGTNKYYTIPVTADIMRKMYDLYHNPRSSTEQTIKITGPSNYGSFVKMKRSSLQQGYLQRTWSKFMHRTYGEHKLNGLNLTNKCNIIEKIKDKKDTAYIIKHTLVCWPSKGYQKVSSKFIRQQVIPTKCGVNLQHSLKSLEEMIKSRYNLSIINEMPMATPYHRTQEFFYYRCLDGISCDKKGIYYVRLLCFIEMECTKDATLRTCFFEDQLMWLVPKVYRTRDPLKRNPPYDHSPGVCTKTGKSFLTYCEKKLWMLNMKDCYERKIADLELCAKECYCLEVQDRIREEEHTNERIF